MKTRWLVSLFALGLAILACTNNNPRATSTPSAIIVTGTPSDTPEPTATLTATLTSSATPRPSATPTRRPSNTPRPANTARPTSQPATSAPALPPTWTSAPPTQEPPPPPPPTDEPPPPPSADCSSYITCGSWSTCQQAYDFLAACPQYWGKADNDGDGVPCESICPGG